MWVQSQGRRGPLDEDIATYFSVLAWRNPWTVEPGGLQSTGVQRVGHTEATWQAGTYSLLSVQSYYV